MEDAPDAEVKRAEVTPERGSMNEDGSVNLGLRRRPNHNPLTIAPEPRMPRAQAQPTPPLPSMPDLAAYHQANGGAIRDASGLYSEDNRLAPLASLAASSERQPSLSPGSLMSRRRKRSSSATDTEMGSVTDGGYENSKRISSIKSILNPTSQGYESPNSDGQREYTLPPLRSPGHGMRAPSRSPNMSFSRGHTPNAGPMPPARTSSGWDVNEDVERIKAEKRAALMREAERMREELAATERELQELN
jgi:GATA-binding protein